MIKLSQVQRSLYTNLIDTKGLFLYSVIFQIRLPLSKHSKIQTKIDSTKEHRHIWRLISHGLEMRWSLWSKMGQKSDKIQTIIPHGPILWYTLREFWDINMIYNIHSKIIVPVNVIQINLSTNDMLHCIASWTFQTMLVHARFGPLF